MHLMKSAVAALFLFACLASTSLSIAAPAVYDEETRQLTTACVEPQVGGEPSLKDGQPRTRAVTFQFNPAMSEATVVSVAKMPKTADCSGVFELSTGVYSDRFNYGGEVLPLRLHFSGGLSFSVLEFIPDVGGAGGPALWRVTNGTNELVIAGVVKSGESEFTGDVLDLDGIDFLRPFDFPLPDAYLEVYGQSGIVVTQSRPGDIYSNPIVLNTLFINSESTLSALLDPGLYDELEAHLDSVGMAIEKAGDILPHWLAEMLYLLELVNAGYVPGVESTLLELAAVDGKEVLGLEPGVMVMVVQNLNAEDDAPDTIIREALHGIGDGRYLAEMDALINAWRAWDESVIESILVDPLRNDSLEDFMREFTSRHQLWLPEIEAMLATQEQEMVFIHVKHLAGPDSFLRLLEESGFSVEKYASE